MIYGIFAPIWLQFGIKIRPRRLRDASKRPQNAPSWCPRRPKSRPRGAPDASRTTQELPKKHPGGGPEPLWSQMTPKSSPRAAQKLPRPPSRPRFWTILATIWKDFGIILNGFFQTNWIQTLETIRWQCWGGCAPPHTPCLEERT